MKKMSRRDFVRSSAGLAAGLLARRLAFANPLGLPLGIQLYSVRQQMAQDLDGTLAAVAEAGFIEVEAASLPNKSSKEIRAALDKAGLRCVSAHHGFGDIYSRFDELVTYDKELGAQFIICASPGSRPAASGGAPHTGMTLDDWHYSADQFNALGESASRMGIRFGYHNHTGEFKLTEGRVPLMELLLLTSPEKVTFELDCGWVVVGQAKPAEILRDNPHRFSMLHVKDFKFVTTGTNATDAKVTELGLGTIDYIPIFAQAAKTQHIQHAFVEQEGFDMPWTESLKVDAAYMRNFSLGRTKLDTQGRFRQPE